MRRVLFLIGFLCLATSTALAQDAVKVSPETHKVLLENDWVRVLDVRVEPGEKVPMHSHPASVVYFLSGGMTKRTYPDGKTEERKGKAGVAVWSEAETHATENVGTTELHVVQVELKGPAKEPALANKETSKNGHNVEKEVRALQAQLVQALLKGDTSFFDRYFADDATIIHGDGKLYTKAEDYEIKGLKSGAIKYESIDVPESKIRVYGDTAVVTSLSFGKGAVNGKPYSFEGRITRVWVKQKGEWKMVASQYTRVVPAPAEAQQAAKIPRVGFLAPQGRSLPLFDAFRQGLADLGYVEGRSVVIEPRFAEGHYERFPEILAELVRLKVDVLVVTGAVTARAAKKAVAGIPIVFAVVVDPVADNVVPSFERPGGNLTGVTSFDPQQATKQFEVLRKVIPGLRRVAILGDQGVSEALMKASEEQARALGLQPQRHRVAGPSPDLEAAFAAMRQEHADALLVLEEPVLGVHATKIAELAARDRIPTLFPPSRVAAGGLIAYGTSQTEAIRRMAAYVDKVLKGAKPGDLSVDRITRYELIVNLKTAQQIGVTIPPEVLKRADRVIQ